MTKNEFLSALERELRGLPREDVERFSEYYAELIEDKSADEGVSEEMAVASLGTPQEVAASLLLEQPLPKIVKARAASRRKMPAWEIVLIVLGAPLWLPLLLALAVVVLSVYIVLWSVVLVVCAVTLALALALPVGIVAGIVLIVRGAVAAGILLLGGGMLCSGLGVLLYFVCRWLVKGAAFVGKKLWRVVKGWFVKKGDAK